MTQATVHVAEAILKVCDDCGRPFHRSQVCVSAVGQFRCPACASRRRKVPEFGDAGALHSTGNVVARGTSRRWKARVLRRAAICRCGRAPVRPGQRDCRSCHRAAGKASRRRVREKWSLLEQVLACAWQHVQDANLSLDHPLAVAVRAAGEVRA